jgi:hypothetical protein
MQKFGGYSATPLAAHGFEIFIAFLRLVLFPCLLGHRR